MTRWRLQAAQPFPAAAAMAVALLGNRRRRRPVPLGRIYTAATWWDTPAGKTAGIAYKHLPPPEQTKSGVFASTMGAEFVALATAEGLHVRATAPDLTPEQLQTAVTAIRRVTTPETLAVWGAAEAERQPCPKCHACGRPLADAASLSRGFGPDCWARLTDAIKGSAALEVKP